MNQTVRVRYAPSPTGLPHVGNIRTALFNWLFARHNKGKFILRIEDTDVARTQPGALESIMDSLRWLGLDWDEGPEVGGPFGPYFQSQRLDIYRSIAEKLIASGQAYYCFCSPERLEAMRAEQAKRKEPPRYDRRCRDLSPEEVARLRKQAITPVVRFKIPLEGRTAFNDLLRGEVSFENSTLDDLVLLKSDGYPTYHLANVTDDHLMEISHVLRADEWVSSTPRHVLIYKALDFQPPAFAHLPIILGPDRAKLSKRHGATAVTEFKEQGYLPEAMVNFLALLGWSLDEKTELMSREELAANFSLERVGRTAAIFNLEKLNWMNGVYMRRLRPQDLCQQVMPFIESGLGPEPKCPVSDEYVSLITPLVQDRARTLREFAEFSDFFFYEDLKYEPEMLLKAVKNRYIAVHALKTARQAMSEMPRFDATSLECLFRPLAGELGLKPGEFFGLTRGAVTGKTATPPLFETMAVLGLERCLKRIDAAIRSLAMLSQP
ncbi:MAG: glutamate--tRNA ligase [Chloroflexi bacterium]|nr:glutamate--tRNA ligase [Chloroflexota bacterium]